MALYRLDRGCHGHAVRGSRGQDRPGHRAPGGTDSIRAKQYPPIVVFPEGTRNPLDTLLPFRYGVFEIASEIEMPYLLWRSTTSRPMP